MISWLWRWFGSGSVATGATFPEDSFPTTLTAPMTEYALSVEGERYDLTVTQTEFRLTFEG